MHAIMAYLLRTDIFFVREQQHGRHGGCTPQSGSKRGRLVLEALAALAGQQQKAPDQTRQDEVEIAIHQRIEEGKELSHRREGHQRPHPPGELAATAA